MKKNNTYNVNDKVCFKCDDDNLNGTIAIVDAFGIFGDNSMPYYDILVKQKDGTQILYKHVPESSIIDTNTNKTTNTDSKNSISKIYITGDKHGDVKLFKSFADEHATNLEDTMIILGDAGLNYYLDFRDILKKDYLKYTSLTFFCVHGNHEERPYNVGGYKLVNFMGAKAYVEDMFPNVYFAKDGEIYDFNGKSVICIGGAYSVDKGIRLAMGYKWYESEQPNTKIKNFVEKQLNKVNWKVDYILTHICPSKYVPTDCFINGVNQEGVDRSTEEWLDDIENKLSYNKWFCGHWHTDRLVDNVRFMFNEIIEFR